MKKITLFLFVILILSGCSAKPDKILNKNDIANMKIGVVMGSQAPIFVDKEYPKAKLLEYNSVTDLVLALKTRKVDCAIFDYLSLKPITVKDDTLSVLPDYLTQDDYAIAVKKGNTKLLNELNAFIDKIKSDGTYDDIYKRWVTEQKYEMPEIKSSGEKGDITVGVSSVTALPLCGVVDGKAVGYNLEIAARFAAELGYNLKISDMEFGALIPALASGKIDFSANDLIITEERKKQVDFSKPYDKGGLAILVLKERVAQ